MKIGKDINTARLICDVTPEEREYIKMRAREQGITVRQYIYTSLFVRQQFEDKKKLSFAVQDK